MYDVFSFGIKQVRTALQANPIGPSCGYNMYFVYAYTSGNALDLLEQYRSFFLSKNPEYELCKILAFRL